jgi:hypothetical protein
MSDRGSDPEATSREEEEVNELLCVTGRRRYRQCFDPPPYKRCSTRFSKRQNFFSQIHKAQRTWGNAQVTGACPCASARTHDHGLCKFTRQPPLENVENGRESRDIAEILAILIHLRANLHSGAEYGWAMPSCVLKVTVVVDFCFCLEILFVVAEIRHPRLPAHNMNVNWRE